ncbi:integral membrane protein [Motilibacter rhizosphaerae]|uniref:Integral membrane protein n=1 Tax=Motilibacter rhizosphaerae TaxID=598652 RepID=A0A4Q7NQZ4_9ACTN|nr:DUF3817 domain-containing protein [Motilibacter rhizosphaerae]RZS87592.1 integral membrane protein [Motilibacter rhizosphaerae]
MRSALLRYRVMAYVTGTVLLAGTVLLVAKALGIFATHGTPVFYSVLWIAHGYLYIVYCVTGVNLALKERWGLVKTLLVLLAGTVPAMSFVAERRVVADTRARASVA